MGHGNETSLDYPEHLYHDPYDVDRLAKAARKYLDVSESSLGVQMAEMPAARAELVGALAAFPEETPEHSPCLSLVHPGEPVPPGGGRYATDAEYRRHVLATTLSAAEYRRFAAGRRKEVRG